MDFMSIFTVEGFQAFATVVMIDLVLAGDNAVVIGLAAAGLPKEQRGKAILIGVIAATVLRILFALVATQLLAIIGLLFAGGVLLLGADRVNEDEDDGEHERDASEGEHGRAPLYQRASAGPRGDQRLRRNSTTFTVHIGAGAPFTRYGRKVHACIARVSSPS